MRRRTLSRTLRRARQARGASAPPYVYRPISPFGNGDHSDPVDRAAPALSSFWNPADGASSDGEKEWQAREQRARELGLQEGLAQAQAEMESILSREREALGAAIRDFARERGEYFRRVEAEVVRLALAIARKVLHREAQIDPLLLQGVVRVALEKVAAATEVRLRVHPHQMAAWQGYFAGQPELQPAPELVADAGLEPSQGVLETELGAVDLSREVQLKEIEQGFFDLLAQRPEASR